MTVDACYSLSLPLLCVCVVLKKFKIEVYFLTQIEVIGMVSIISLCSLYMYHSHLLLFFVSVLISLRAAISAHTSACP